MFFQIESTTVSVMSGAPVPGQANPENTRPPRTILVVEDNKFLLDIVTASLNTPGFQAYGASTPAEAWDLFESIDPDAVVLDIELGSGANGLDLGAEMMEKSPGIGVVFLTELAHPRISKPEWTDLPPGAGFLTKSKLTSLADLIDALEAVLTVDPDNPPRHDKSGGGVWDDLSKAQIEVLGLIAQGMSNTDIAKHRGTQVRAVEALISRTFDQLNIDTPGTDGNRRVLAARTFLLASRNSKTAS
jgi:DNA-binding NarL/FixJ family response regulator